jgi:hypothetical protein
MGFKNAIWNISLWALLSGLPLFHIALEAQTPVITVRFANPQNDCVTQEYCLDVEFRSDMTDQELFGMNVRFFYDDDVLEFVDFRDFQGGYGAVVPDPPIISTSEPAGPALFNFEGAAEFVNGAIQLVDLGPPPIILDTGQWSKIFQICFLVDDPNANLDTFCPSIVWDLEQNPLNGGFLAGDDGVVMTVVDPDPNNESLSADENVVQFNWQYIGNGQAPFGEPVDSVCSNINCTLPLTLLSFTGKALGEGNLLQWQTYQEINVAGFHLQRSADRISWKDIAYLEAAASGFDIEDYSFLDPLPGQGTYYYRLLQSDHDGKSHYSHLISISNLLYTHQVSLTVYPNPSGEDKIYINCSQVDEQGGIVQLLDATGQVVKKLDFAQSGMELDISMLPAGIYLVCLTAQGERFLTRLVIQ